MAWWAIPAAMAGGSIVSALGQERANRKNLQIAREQMRFQERMSSTQMQRRVKDLRRAGLNPMLAYQQGGASSPSGQRAEMQNVMSGVASTAIDIAKSVKELRLLDAQTQKTSNEAMVANSEAILRNLLARAMGTHPKGFPMDSLQLRLLQTQLASAKNQVRLQESGYMGRIAGLTASGNFVELLKWLLGGTNR